MQTHFYQILLLTVVFSGFTHQKSLSLPTVSAPAPPLDEQNRDLNQPVCYLQTSSGTIVNLEQLCGTTFKDSQGNQPTSNRVQSASSGSPPDSNFNPGAFGANRAYAQDVPQ
ncbi:hypothetical protein BST81_21250 [Leptolyngbya sp. 'hensonii']|uniref:hypothetical protein n=1 Tax=Leptolyngbya sp. 'hensonii' TaxID=1922337 RepID=UPI00094F9322|nr:hypothetical protein [Leptolyngbya sp. 'hensonii']OLP16328.1 hypothetical protein BST81_21250 [Leptolyngbya sp. 'hensonii']